MREIDAIDFFKELCKKHGYRPIPFGFNNRKAVLGLTHVEYDKPTKITISKHYLKQGTDQEIKETIIHEFAHMVDLYQRGYSDHGQKFKELCKSFGIDGKATKETSFEMFVYHIKCSKCNKIVDRLYRLSKKYKERVETERYKSSCCREKLYIIKRG